MPDTSIRFDGNVMVHLRDLSYSLIQDRIERQLVTERKKETRGLEW